MNIPGAVEGFRRSFALLVAIDRYGNGVPELRTPVSDAEKLAEVLRRDHGFDVEVILDDKATLSALGALLDGLATRVSGDDRVLLCRPWHRCRR